MRSARELSDELAAAAAGRRVEFVLGPEASEEIPDDDLRFRVAILGTGWIGLSEGDRVARMDRYLREWARTRRALRNALAFAPPEAEGEGNERGQARYRFLYMPVAGDDLFERIDFGPNADDAGVPAAIERVLAPRLRESVTPTELAGVIGLGRVDPVGVRRNIFPLREAIRWFFCFPGWPRFADEDPLLSAVIEGVRAAEFGLLRSAGLPPLDTPDPAAHGSVIADREISRGDLSAREGLWLVTPTVLR